MDLRPDLQLQSMVKAMTDVVLPAIDPNNQLANEQAQLVLGMMQLMRARLPWQFDYDVDELKRAIALSAEILTDVRGGDQTAHACAALATASDDAQDVLSAAKVSPATLESEILKLRAQTSELLRALWADGVDECRQRIDKAVLQKSHEQIARERAWFAPQGWDAKEEEPAPLETFFESTESR